MSRVDTGKLSNSGVEPTEAIEADASNAGSEVISASPEKQQQPRPIPEITAEIIRDMDNLCDWLHKVQKLHLEITRVRRQRMEVEIAARWAQIQAEQDAIM